MAHRQKISAFHGVSGGLDLAFYGMGLQARGGAFSLLA
jgi:hypothetical protein